MSLTSILLHGDKSRGQCWKYCRYLLKMLPLLLLTVNYGCNQQRAGKPLKEGVIEYAITYNDTEQTKFDPSLRPNRMVIKFRENNTLNKIEGFSGAISFSLIQNTESNKNITLIKLLNKKLCYLEPLEDGQYPFAYSDMPTLSYELTNETEDLLGYKSYKAIAWFEGSEESQFEILYTKELGIENPNRNTPFEFIDGVMLKFSIKLYNQSMNVAAQSIRHTKVSKEEFTVPFDYEEVSIEVLQDVISLLQ